MANLRADLLNELRNQKYYAELELVRLANEANMNYREKIESLCDVLLEISTINQQIGLADAYFQAPVEQPMQQPVGEPTAMPLVHQGQSHGE